MTVTACLGISKAKSLMTIESSSYTYSYDEQCNRSGLDIADATLRAFVAEL